jgi:hypothetical protein
MEEVNEYVLLPRSTTLSPGTAVAAASSAAETLPLKEASTSKKERGAAGTRAGSAARGRGVWPKGDVNVALGNSDNELA